MKLIGLTGNIASGKSKISEYLKTKGFKIIDADSIGKTVLSLESVKNKVVRTFGKNILNEDGSINRRELGNIVFSSKENLKRLNRITLPILTKLIKKKINELKRKKTKYVILDAAILIEARWHKFVDEVWVVYTDPETQLERLIKRENYSIEEAKNRIEAQLNIEEKLKYADRVINNSYNWENTKEQIDNILKEIFKNET
ncbi:MAG: dephospho-CoA kinase [Caldisericia bacterium]|jgi:dephospho-CoA kinase|nr:dephospho-CoA kinase [Caldisericia bacterium]